MIDPENLKHIAAIVGAILTFGLGIAKIWYDYFINQKNVFPNLFRSIETIYNELDVSIRHSSCARVLLLKTENGGGVPKVGSKIKSSVVFERTKDEISATKKQWQGQDVDSVYIKNMVTMLVSENNYADLPVERWEGSVVYDAYKASGINSSRLYEIARSKTAYYYLSFNFQQTSDKITSKDKSVMNGVASNIRRVFRKGNLDF